MKGSHKKRFKRAAMALMSVIVVTLVAAAFFQLTHLTDSLQAQVLPEVEFSGGSSITVGEGDGTLVLTVDIDQAPISNTATINYVALPASATTSDYTLASGTLSWPVGDDTSKTISITIIDDAIDDNSEFFYVQLENPTQADIGSPFRKTVNITDNDAASGTPTPQVFADIYEPNNTFNEATETAADAAALCDLTFYPPGDQDYFRWWGKAGITYIVSTFDLDAGLDSVLDVYDGNQNLIASNDDIAPGFFESEVSFTASADGYFYARVTNKTPVDPVNKFYCFEVFSTVSDTPTPPPIFPEGNDGGCEYNSTINTACLIVVDDPKISMNFAPTFGSTQDTDIYKLWIKPGIFYTCETTIPPGSAADTNMIFWDNNGNPFNPWLGNDDKVQGGLDFGSEVSYLSSYTGWLFIVIGPVNVPPLDEAEHHIYDLTCTAVESTPTSTPFPTSVPGTGGTGGGFSPTATPQPTQAFPTPFPTPTPFDISQFFTPTPAPPPVVQFQPLPTSTPVGGSTQSATINVTLYYDSNNNFLPELTEGIVNANVALYDNGTGQLLSFGQTNETGVARFTAVNATGAVRVVVPFLNYNQVVVSGNAEILVRVAPQPLPIGIP